MYAMKDKQHKFESNRDSMGSQHSVTSVLNVSVLQQMDNVTLFTKQNDWLRPFQAISRHAR